MQKQTNEDYDYDRGSSEEDFDDEDEDIVLVEKKPKRGRGNNKGAARKVPAVKSAAGVVGPWLQGSQNCHLFFSKCVKAFRMFCISGHL